MNSFKKNSLKLIAFCVVNLCVSRVSNASSWDLERGTARTTDRQLDAGTMQDSYRKGKNYLLGGFPMWGVSCWALIVRNYIADMPSNSFNLSENNFDACCLWGSVIAGGLMGNGFVKMDQAAQSLLSWNLNLEREKKE